jgi:hypothetical protein
MTGIRSAFAGRRPLVVLSLQALVLGLWAIAAMYFARVGSRNLNADLAAAHARTVAQFRNRGKDADWLSPGNAPLSEFTDAAMSGVLRVAALAGLALLLAWAGRRWAAILLPAVVIAPAVIWPLSASLLGPQYLGMSMHGLDPWSMRVGELLTLAVVVLPAALLGIRRERTVPARLLVSRLAIPVAVAGAFAAFEWVDPNGSGATQWAVVGVWPLAAALLVTTAMPRRVLWPVLLVTLVVFQRAVAQSLVTGNVSDLLGAWPVVAATVAVAGWMLLAPHAAALWRGVLRRGPDLSAGPATTPA